MGEEGDRSLEGDQCRGSRGEGEVPFAVAVGWDAVAGGPGGCLS